ncbi:MAG: CHAD domain-containing protein [Verrucomicrobia bacterium]|nr:CHAD domain-containing protein [Deltaproteobacteria bacterium]
MKPKPDRIPPDPAVILERSRGVFFAQWEELLRLRRSVLKTSDLDDIHDLRVASRRLRAALELFEPVAPKTPIKELRKNIRSLTSSLGGLRNIDEALLFFRSRITTDATIIHNLLALLAKNRSRELNRINKALVTFDHRHLDRMVREIVASMNEISINKRDSFSLLAYFSDVSIRRYSTIYQHLAGSIAPERRESRHALRIGIKKWRYFLETIATVVDRDYSALLGELKEYQSILGQMNDIAEFEMLLGTIELPPDERAHVEAILRAEDALLLMSFTEIIESKPLSYSFLI